MGRDAPRAATLRPPTDGPTVWVPRTTSPPDWTQKRALRFLRSAPSTGPARRATEIRVPLRQALFVTAVLWLATVFWTAVGLADATRFYWDEFLTLERSQGFARYGDWTTVYENGGPSFKKPPLQYWLTGILIQLGVEPGLAIRVWNHVFFAGLGAATVLLAFATTALPWAMPASLLLLVAYAPGVVLARGGHLDVGQAFFLVLALAACLLAQRRAGWWVVAGAAVGLGALQKTPVALFGVVTVVVLLRTLAPEAWRARAPGGGSARIGLALGAIGVLGWPALELARHGGRWSRVFFGKQMAHRFRPENPIGDGEALGWLGWLSQGWGWAAWASLAALALVVAVGSLRRQRRLLCLTLFACLSLLVLTVAGGKLYDRYLIVVVPLLAVVTASVAAELGRSRAVPLALALALLVANAPVLRVAHGDALREADAHRVDRIQAAVAAFDASYRRGETPVFVVAASDPRTNPAAFRCFSAVEPPSVAMFLHRDPAHAARDARRRGGPYRGLAPLREREALRAAVGEFTVVEVVEPFFVWTAESVDPTDPESS